MSDGDAALAAEIDWVYRRRALHQLCVFHLLREYRRNLGTFDFAAAPGLLQSASLAEGREWARRLIQLAIFCPVRAAAHWCAKRGPKGCGI